MLHFIRGIVASKKDTHAVLDCHGVGFTLLCAPSTLAQISVGDETTLFCYLQTREDSMTLLGFKTEEEQELFQLLLGVSGVGPKVALSLCGSAPVNQIMMYIVTEDVDMLSKAPGVGKKTAQRIVLELKEKIGAVTLPQTQSQQNLSHMSSGTRDDALDALLTLGYSRAEAASALSEVFSPDASTEALIKGALKKIVSKRI